MCLRREDIGTTVDIIWTPTFSARSAVSNLFFALGLWRPEKKSSEILQAKDHTLPLCEGKAVAPASAWMDSRNGGVKKI